MTTLTSTYQLNQFAQKAVRGQLMGANNNNIKANDIVVENTNTVSPGDMLVLGANGYREVVATDTAASLAGKKTGFLVEGTNTKPLKADSHNKKQSVANNNCYMMMMAEGAINKGDIVCYDATTTVPANTGKVLAHPGTLSAGQIPCGVAETAAAADGDLIEVYIKEY